MKKLVFIKHTSAPGAIVDASTNPINTVSLGIFIPIRMRKLKFKEFEEQAQDHTANNWYRCDLNGCSTLKLWSFHNHHGYPLDLLSNKPPQNLNIYLLLLWGVSWSLADRSHASWSQLGSLIHLWPVGIAGSGKSTLDCPWWEQPKGDSSAPRVSHPPHLEERQASPGMPFS